MSDHELLTYLIWFVSGVGVGFFTRELLELIQPAVNKLLSKRNARQKE